MDTMSAFLRAKAAAQQGAELKVFDWVKSAQIIKERCAKNASAGLAGDWEWTGGQILKDGVPVDRKETYTYLASLWATPELEVDGSVIPCFLMKSQKPEWDSDTYWPKEALDVLNS